MHHRSYGGGGSVTADFLMTKERGEQNESCLLLRREASVRRSGHISLQISPLPPCFHHTVNAWAAGREGQQATNLSVCCSNKRNFRSTEKGQRAIVTRTRSEFATSFLC